MKGLVAKWQTIILLHFPLPLNRISIGRYIYALFEHL